jgi:hypothetical protein
MKKTLISVGFAVAALSLAAAPAFAYHHGGSPGVTVNAASSSGATSTAFGQNTNTSTYVDGAGQVTAPGATAGYDYNGTASASGHSWWSAPSVSNSAGAGAATVQLPAVQYGGYGNFFR